MNGKMIQTTQITSTTRPTISDRPPSAAAAPSELLLAAPTGRTCRPCCSVAAHHGNLNQLHLGLLLDTLFPAAAALEGVVQCDQDISASFDFPQAHLSHDRWERFGDAESGLRLAVVFLAVMLHVLLDAMQKVDAARIPANAIEPGEKSLLVCATRDDRVLMPRCYFGEREVSVAKWEAASDNFFALRPGGNPTVVEWASSSMVVRRALS